MKKLYLTPDEILKSLDLGDYAGELADYAGSSSYVCDAIAEIADRNTSIDYGDIISYIADHVEEVSDTINEFGWDGCGGDLYKAGQLAEYNAIYNDVDCHLDGGLKIMALDYITGRTCDHSGLHYSAIPAALCEAVEECIGNSPDRIDEITDVIDDWDNAHQFAVYEDNARTVTVITFDEDETPDYIRPDGSEAPGFEYFLAKELGR